MQNAEAVLAVLRERGRKRETSSRSRHKSLESPVHRKVPAGFGGRLRGKGPQQRDLAAQPILLLDVLAQHDVEVAWSGDQEVSRHSRRSVPMMRSAIAFARGARIGV